MSALQLCLDSLVWLLIWMTFFAFQCCPTIHASKAKRHRRLKNSNRPFAGLSPWVVPFTTFVSLGGGFNPFEPGNFHKIVGMKQDMLETTTWLMVHNHTLHTVSTNDFGENWRDIKNKSHNNCILGSTSHRFLIRSLLWDESLVQILPRIRLIHHFMCGPS